MTRTQKLPKAYDSGTGENIDIRCDGLDNRDLAATYGWPLLHSRGLSLLSYRRASERVLSITFGNVVDVHNASCALKAWVLTNRCTWLWDAFPITVHKGGQRLSGEINVRYLQYVVLSSGVRAKTNVRRGPHPALRLKIGTTGKIRTGPVYNCDPQSAHGLRQFESQDFAERRARCNI